jgi:hypothetical protein
LEALKAPALTRHADYGYVERTALDHSLHRWKDLLESQISCSAEENESIRFDFGHGDVSECPPKVARMAPSLTKPLATSDDLSKTTA